MSYSEIKMGAICLLNFLKRRHHIVELLVLMEAIDMYVQQFQTTMTKYIMVSAVFLGLHGVWVGGCNYSFETQNGAYDTLFANYL